MLSHFEREAEAIIHRLCNAFTNTILRMMNKGVIPEEQADIYFNQLEKIRNGEDAFADEIGIPEDCPF